MNLGFLDFRGRSDREAVCHREVELNRRLAPDVYLGVADIHGPVLDAGDAAEVEARTHEFLAGREPLFADRIAHGHIVDGHADLIADDIFCLDDGPRVIDCLEFDDRLRYVDVLDDAAFLAMDVEHLGVPACRRPFSTGTPSSPATADPWPRARQIITDQVPDRSAERALTVITEEPREQIDSGGRQ